MHRFSACPAIGLAGLAEALQKHLLLASCGGAYHFTFALTNEMGNEVGTSRSVKRGLVVKALIPERGLCLATLMDP